MKRISLTDGTGKWFDSETAVMFEEETYHNGSNWISKATGSQWNHERLYQTKSGRWILNTYSQVQGTPEAVYEIEAIEAAQWFGKQGFQDEQVPKGLKSHMLEMEM
jgi:hypothetical protein